mmetsp:Transcript_24515/g.97267  ORF Transcript_24515/g.97267 Transcript_24515/m.97267 type:complete len:265 (-) Transcript_24515:1079-1873(-)
MLSSRTGDRSPPFRPESVLRSAPSLSRAVAGARGVRIEDECDSSEEAAGREQKKSGPPGRSEYARTTYARTHKDGRRRAPPSLESSPAPRSARTAAPKAASVWAASTTGTPSMRSRIARHCSFFDPPPAVATVASAGCAPRALSASYPDRSTSAIPTRSSPSSASRGASAFSSGEELHCRRRRRDTASAAASLVRGWRFGSSTGNRSPVETSGYTKGPSTATVCGSSRAERSARSASSNSKLRNTRHPAFDAPPTSHESSRRCE